MVQRLAQQGKLAVVFSDESLVSVLLSVLVNIDLTVGPIPLVVGLGCAVLNLLLCIDDEAVFNLTVAVVVSAARTLAM